MQFNKGGKKRFFGVEDSDVVAGGRFAVEVED